MSSSSYGDVEQPSPAFVCSVASALAAEEAWEASKVAASKDMCERARENMHVKLTVGTSRKVAIGAENGWFQVGLSGGERESQRERCQDELNILKSFQAPQGLSLKAKEWNIK